MAWHDKYTNAEIENLLTNMCDWIRERLDNYYNWGGIETIEELIKFHVDMGLHEDEVRSWYSWMEE